MIGIVIVAHGHLAAEYRAAVEHVLGPLEAVETIAIGPEDDRDAKKDEIRAAARAVDRGDGVAIVVDMFGGSPSNLSLPACERSGRCILYGANLPMLVKLAKRRHNPLADAVSAARDAGRKYIDLHHPMLAEEG